MEANIVYWANRSYDHYDDLRLAAIDAWQKAAIDSELAKSAWWAPYESCGN